MRVGVFSYYYLPIINGVTITIADWKLWGGQQGHRFTIYVPKLEPTNVRRPDVVSYPAISLYRRFGITVPVFAEPFVEREIRVRHLDVLHVHHPYYIGRLALFAKKKFAIPLIFTYHTRYADYARSYLPFASKIIIHRYVTKLIVRFMNECSAVTVANESLRKELMRSGVRVPVHVVPPGVDTASFASGDRSGTRKRLDISPKEKVLLYVGRLAKEKNIYFLLKAFIHIAGTYPAVRLVLCGHGLEADRIMAFARKKHIEHRITLALTETPDTVKDMYSAADLFVYASRTETYGRVVVEAMSAGLPIVALRGPSIVDLIRDGRTGRIVDRNTPKQFARVVSELIEDPKRARRYGFHAKKEAVLRYDSRVSWLLLEEVFRSVLS